MRLIVFNTMTLFACFNELFSLDILVRADSSQMYSNTFFYTDILCVCIVRNILNQDATCHDRNDKI